MQQLTSYPSIDKPWLKYYSEEAHHLAMPECTCYDYLCNAAKGHENDTALLFLNKKISYGKTLEAIERTAAAFVAAGVKRGDIVTTNLPSTPEMVYVFYALAKIGAMTNIIDPRSDAKMLKYYLDEAESKVLVFLDLCMPVVEKVLKDTSVETAICVTATESLPLIDALSGLKGRSKGYVRWKQFLNQGKGTVAAQCHDHSVPVLMTHTSGTTGMPKGVVLSHSNVNAVVHQYSVGMEHNRSQRYLCIIPPFVAFGICVAIHLPLGLGMGCVLIPKFDANKFPEYLHKYRPEHFCCAPMSLEPLIKSDFKEDLSYLKTPAVGGDYVSPVFEQRVNEFLFAHGCTQPLIKGYGMTEVSSSACTTSARCNASGSVGVPLAAMTISVFKIGTTEELPCGEEGEICFTGPNVMMGYYKNQEATHKALQMHPDGKIWMHSGDVGYMNEDGLVFVIDRLKRTAVRDGRLILPSKAERIIMALPEVDKCAVVTNDKAALVVFCVPKQGCDSAALEEIIKATCKLELPEHMLIYKIFFCDSLPLTSVGKVDFLELEKSIEKGTKK